MNNVGYEELRAVVIVRKVEWLSSNRIGACVDTKEKRSIDDVIASEKYTPPAAMNEANNNNAARDGGAPSNNPVDDPLSPEQHLCYSLPHLGSEVLVGPGLLVVLLQMDGVRGSHSSRCWC